MKKINWFLGCTLLVSCLSCGIENTAPIVYSNDLVARTSLDVGTSVSTEVDAAMGLMKHADELNAILNTIPNFEKPEVNDQMAHLSTAIKNYISAKKSGKKNVQTFAFRDYERFYIELQKLKNYQNPDEVDYLNRNLTRIKTHMNALKSLSTN